MEAHAINRYIGTSPRKMRLVIDLIRGKSVDEALHILHFSPKHASKVAEKVLRSAVSNLQNKDQWKDQAFLWQALGRPLSF